MEATYRNMQTFSYFMNYGKFKNIKDCSSALGIYIIAIHVILMATLSPANNDAFQKC